MMVETLSQVVVLLLSAFLVSRCENSRSARALAMKGATVVTVMALAQLVASTVQSGTFLWWFPLSALVAITTLVAVGLSSLGNTTPRTFATILALSAVSSTVGPLDAGVGLAAVWLIGTVLLWLEVRQRNSGAARLFAIYLFPSTLLVCGALCVGFSSTWAVVALILGVWIRLAAFPLHTWFLRFVETMPMGLVVSSTAPQIGIVLLLKFGGTTLHGRSGMAIAGLALGTALFGAVLATGQSHLKRTLAYLLMSAGGLVTFGLVSTSEIGHVGLLATWLVVGLGAAGFAMTIEALQARSVSAMGLDQPGGDFEATPLLATSFLLCGLTMFGLPGSLGFIAEDLLLEGAVTDFPHAGFLLIAVATLNVFTVMRCLLTVFVGPRSGGGVDLQPRERAAMTVLLGALFTLGMCPWILVTWFG